jgi:DNA primase
VISDDDREKVRAATDIVSLVGETVVLRQRGAEFWGCCPFHHEKSPSFHVNPQTGLWNCFGCHQGGDVFDYVMKRESLDFPDSIRFLADRANIELTEERGAARGPRRNRVIEALEEAQSFYSTLLMRGRAEGAADARSYLAGRGFGSDVCSRWHLGFAPGHGALVEFLRGKGFSRDEIVSADLAVDRGGRAADRFYDRVMFPIHDEQGRCIGFGGRVLGDGKPKYLNTRETSVFHKSKNMFAFDYAKESIVSEGYVIVVEGYTDVIAMHENGFRNVVATLGTALTLDHVKALSRFAKTIICMFDGDSAGQNAADHAVQYVDKTRSDFRCVVLPDNLDPAEFLAARGADAMRPHIAAASPLIDYVFERRLSAYDLTVPGNRVAAMDEMATLLAPLKRSVLLDTYATRLADRLNVDVEQARQAIRDKPVVSPEDASPRPATPSTSRTEVPEATPVPQRPAPRVLGADERVQLTVEHELLSLMASDPELLRSQAERIGSLSWADDRDQTMAWAILSTPVGTPPADAVALATRACPDAPRIIASGDVTTDGMTQTDRAAFLLDNLDLFSTRRKIRAIRSELDAGGSDRPAEELFQKATDLQEHVAKLTKRITAMTPQRKNG